MITLSIPSFSAYTGGTFAVTKQCTCKCFLSISIWSFSWHFLASSPKSNSSFTMFVLLLSNLERDNKSVTNFDIRLASEDITPKNFVSITLSWSVSSKVSAYPIIDVIGVFNSCDTSATNSFLILSNFTCSVISCIRTITPAGLSFSSFNISNARFKYLSFTFTFCSDDVQSSR